MRPLSDHSTAGHAPCFLGLPAPWLARLRSTASWVRSSRNNFADVSHLRRERVATSLTDRRRFKAADFVSCYERRWQIETRYHELKQSMLGMELTLRSQTVEGVYQEFWGALIAYNLIRLEMAKAALAPGHAPDELSFIRAFHTIQYEMTWAAVTRSYGKLPALLKRLHERLRQLPNEKRSGRSCARTVKSRPFRYTVRVLKRDLN
ncbi:transposase [Paraburkholderia sp. 35.1]|uniref:transposase n=1 Tax=unclassified Paraburkholderia TaxID=2615204 RepID=UPI003D1CE725